MELGSLKILKRNEDLSIPNFGLISGRNRINNGQNFIAVLGTVLRGSFSEMLKYQYTADMVHFAINKCNS